MGISKTRIALSTGAVAAVVAVAATACGSGGGSSSSSGSSGSGTGGAIADRNTVNSATVKPGGKVTWTIEKTVQDWNPSTSNGNTFDYVQVLNPIYPSVYIANPDYSTSLNTDLLAGEPTFTAASGSTPQKVVYHIQPNAKWSDGTPISADDFVYFWQASNGTNPNVDVATTTGYQDIASVVGSDNGKTVTATWKDGKSFPDWKSLFWNILPSHIAKQHGDVAASFTWFDQNPPTVTGGPYQIAPGGVSADKSLITEVRNPGYYGAPGKLDSVVFRAITDSTQEPTALANNEVNGIYPQPQLDLVNRVKSIPGVDYHINQGLSYEHIDFNLKNTVLGNATYGDALRTAMFTAFDRNGLLGRTIKQFDSDANVLNNRMLVPGQPGYQDNVTQFGLGSGNLAKAKQDLQAAGFTGVGTALVAPDGKPVPAFNMRYTTGNALRQDTCEPVRAVDEAARHHGQRQRHGLAVQDAEQHRRPAQLRHHRLRLGQHAVLRLGEPAAVHDRAAGRAAGQLRLLQQRERRQVDGPGREQPRPGHPDVGAEPGGRPDQQGRLHAPAVPEADDDRLPEHHRQHAGQPDLGRPDVQRPAVGLQDQRQLIRPLPVRPARAGPGSGCPHGRPGSACPVVARDNRTSHNRTSGNTTGTTTAVLRHRP